MLSDNLKPVGFDTAYKESWDEYRVRLNLPNNEAILQFFRQVVYDHFKHFNDRYPNFNLDDYEIVIQIYSAQDANDNIRFFQNEIMDWWGEQYVEYAKRNQKYIIYQSMSTLLTFPFPPIIINPKLIKNEGRYKCGSPLHLIEGTHRVSYLRHMLGLIEGSSKHEFVLLRPRK